MLDTAEHQEQGAGRKVRTIVLLPPEERERLEQLSEETGATQGEILRRAFAQYPGSREGQRA